MTDFKKMYEEKLITVDQAAGMVQDGDLIEMGWTALVPVEFDKALAKRAEELKDVTIRTGVVPYKPHVLEADPNGEHFIWNSWHSSGAERQYFGKRPNTFFIPMRYSELPRYIREVSDKPTIAMMQVSPMDKNGNFNFGLSASHTWATFEMADKIILEVNEKAPVALGGYDNFINIKDVDYIYEANHDMLTLGKAKFGEEEIQVAKHVLGILKDGDTLQLGIGGLPNAIGSEIAKSDLKDLGVHSEMYVDAFVEMSKAGRITGRKKTIDVGRQCYAFAAGSQELYDFIDGNEELMAAPVDYVNGIDVVSSIDNFVSINTAMQVDLWGQISSESVGTRHISGAGGALDFTLGAYKSKGGRSIISLLSSRVDKDGNRTSNIVPTFKPGTQATAVRSNTHYVATEQGIADLKGLTTWQLTETLIGLAHPDNRDELIKEADALHIWRNSNK